MAGKCNHGFPVLPQINDRHGLAAQVEHLHPLQLPREPLHRRGLRCASDGLGLGGRRRAEEADPPCALLEPARAPRTAARGGQRRRQGRHSRSPAGASGGVRHDERRARGHAVGH
uniref:Uncharacterized protein n=1 Tax=Arundo donax TaxID=35708 RepID=A0A0A9FZ53_ARUDO